MGTMAAGGDDDRHGQSGHHLGEALSPGRGRGNRSYQSPFRPRRRFSRTGPPVPSDDLSRLVRKADLRQLSAREAKPNGMGEGSRTWRPDSYVTFMNACVTQARIPAPRCACAGMNGHSGADTLERAGESRCREHQTSIVRFRSAMIAVRIGLGRLCRHCRIESIEGVDHCRSEESVALDQYRAFVDAVSANACPEIAISIVIEAAKARFFVMALFPCV